MGKIGRAERFEQKTTQAMAMRDKDWRRIENAHNPDGDKSVDVAQHLETHRAPDDYIQMLTEAYPYASLPDTSGGISKKVIHDIESAEQPDTKNRMMTKPYHARLNSGTRSWVKHPISGWATMASSALFNAAGLGESAEQVSVYSHNEVPVTVHRFNQGYQTVMDLMEPAKKHNSPIVRTPNPLTVRKIALLDFLMGNNDRHVNNLMISDDRDETGHHKLLAIDHERNFQYDKSLDQVLTWKAGEGIRLGRDFDLPSDFLHRSALNDAAKASYAYDPSDLQEWWSEHGDEIKQAFEQQIEFIRNPRLKEHLQRNFEQRFAIIQHWATPDVENNFEEMDIFNKDFMDSKTQLIKMQRLPKQKVEAIDQRLPENSVKAIMMLSEISGKRKSTKVQQLVKSLFNQRMETLSDEDLTSLYEKVRRDSGKKLGKYSLASELLMSVWKRGDERQAKALYEWDAGRGKFTPFWRARLASMIGAEA